MERTKTLLVILFVVAAFALLFLSVRQSKVADQSEPGVIAAVEAKPAPDFTLPVVAGGNPFQLQVAIKKQPVVLDFWATWCGPCRAELPSIEAVSRKYAGRVAVYGVNSSDTPAQIGAFVPSRSFTGPTLFPSWSWWINKAKYGLLSMATIRVKASRQLSPEHWMRCWRKTRSVLDGLLPHALG
jgi:thiol-disulfide isomerase/thioredoxin